MKLEELIDQHEKSNLDSSRAHMLIEKLLTNKKLQETIIDNAHDALSAVLASGHVNHDDIEEIINRGLDNKKCTA